MKAHIGTLLSIATQRNLTPTRTLRPAKEVMEFVLGERLVRMSGAWYEASFEVRDRLYAQFPWLKQASAEIPEHITESEYPQFIRDLITRYGEFHEVQGVGTPLPIPDLAQWTQQVNGWECTIQKDGPGLWGGRIWQNGYGFWTGRILDINGCYVVTEQTIGTWSTPEHVLDALRKAWSALNA